MVIETIFIVIAVCNQTRPDVNNSANFSLQCRDGSYIVVTHVASESCSLKDLATINKPEICLLKGKCNINITKEEKGTCDKDADIEVRCACIDKKLFYDRCSKPITIEGQKSKVFKMFVASRGYPNQINQDTCSLKLNLQNARVNFTVLDCHTYLTVTNHGIVCTNEKEKGKIVKKKFSSTSSVTLDYPGTPDNRLLLQLDGNLCNYYKKERYLI